MPRGWAQRSVRVYSPATRGACGHALEVHDLLVSKYAAARDKDRELARAVFQHGLARPETVRERLAETSLDPVRLAAALAAVRSGE